MKRYFTLLFFTSLLFHTDLKAQWSQGSFSSLSDKITVTSSGESVGGTNAYQGYLAYGNDDINLTSASIGTAFANVTVANQFKAVAGKPVTITLDFQISNSSAYSPNNRITDAYGGTSALQGGIGKNEQEYAYDNYIQIPKTSDVYDGFYFTSTTFQGTYTFPVGRTQAWLVFTFKREFPGFSLPYTLVLPFVVEGPTRAQVDSLGVTRQPQIPTMVIHTPPGDESYTTVTNTGTQCRSLDEKVSVGESSEFSGAYKLGYKGSVGFIIALELETYVEFSASGTEGSFETKFNSKEHCTTVTTGITAMSNGKGANGNDLFVGYGIDLAYGISRRVNINNGQVSVDTGLVFLPLIETKKEFFLTKQGILEDIANQQAIVEDSLNQTVAKRANAQYQINVWRQVLEKNEANIAAAALQTGKSINFSGGFSQVVDTTIAFNSSQSIEVEHYVDTQFGISTGVYFGGSGFNFGAKFTTNKSFGQTQTTTGGQTKNISVNRYDDESGDYFTVKIVKDPVYGTPIFILDSIGSKTSCPYEGGIQRDNPRLEINGSPLPNITVSNVSLGNAGNFKVKICNNSAEVRDYGFGFVNESIGSDVFISSSASTGSSPFGENITKLGLITAIPAGGCKTTIYDVNVARRFANSPMSYPNIEFVTFAECEPEIRSSIFATVNFATPPPPTNVGASAKEVCAGTAIQLTGNCPVGVPTWYDDPTGGLELGTGATLSVTPAANTNYYLGCVANLYNRDRVGTGEIFVTTPFPTLNLTSDLSFNALQIANTTLTATNKIIDPARVTYKAGNSLTFSPGFEAKSGSTFEAKIGGCGN
jgi:hypothetical protein